MNTNAALRHTFARLMDSSPSDRVVAELTQTGISEEAAQAIVSRAVETLRDARVRDVAASLGRQEKSAADAFEALVSSGVERGFAEALVSEVVERRRWIEEEQQREALDAARLARGQKLLIAAVVLSYAGAKAVDKIPVLLLLVGLSALVLYITSILAIGRGFRWSGATIALTLAVMLIPIVNLFALLWLNSKVTGALREAGYTVGLLGASR